MPNYNNALRWNMRMAPEFEALPDRLKDEINQDNAQARQFKGLKQGPKTTAYVIATVAIQKFLGEKADGKLGPNTMQAIMTEWDEPVDETLVRDTLEEIEKDRDDELIHFGLFMAWMPLHDHRYRAQCLNFLARCKEVGIHYAAFNVNQACREPVWSPEWGDEKIVIQNMNDCEPYFARRFVMPWMYRDPSFNILAAPRVWDIIRRTDADGNMPDVEGQWAKRFLGGPLDDQAKVELVWRNHWIDACPGVELVTHDHATYVYVDGRPIQTWLTILTWCPPQTLALADNAEFTDLVSQMYSQNLPGDSAKARATRERSFRAPYLQRTTMPRMMGLVRKGVVDRIHGGAGGWRQNNPMQTVFESMRANVCESLRQGAQTIWFWDASKFLPGIPPAWPDEEEHAEAFFRLAKHFCGKRRADLPTLLASI